MSAKPSQERGLTGGGLLTLTIQMTVMTRLKPKLQEKENRKSEIDKNKHVSEID